MHSPRNKTHHTLVASVEAGNSSHKIFHTTWHSHCIHDHLDIWDLKWGFSTQDVIIIIAPVHVVIASISMHIRIQMNN